MEKHSTRLRATIESSFRAIAALSTLLVLSPLAASACERCFGAGSDSPVITALGLSMLSLVVVTGFVLTGITKFFRDMTLRAKKLEESGYTERVSEN